MSACDITRDDLRAAEMFGELIREYLIPPPPQTVTEWAEAHRMLSAKDSSEPGPYRVERTPYALQPQNDLSARSSVREVVLMWGAQTSKSTVGNNWVAYTAATQPGPMMLVQPTLDLAKRFSRQRIAPMIEECPALRRKFRENRSRDEANTTLLKEFTGGFVAITGANSAAGLRSMPIRDIFFDEVDAYPHDVDGEGDPVGLAEARQTTFPRRKRLKTSTPTIRSFSRIESDYLRGTRSRYMVKCPHCGEHQALDWGATEDHGIKWDKDERGAPLLDSVRYVCRHNGCFIEERFKPQMLRCQELEGEAFWMTTNPNAEQGIHSYHLSSIYSPLGWLSWKDLVIEWHQAREAQKTGDHSKMRTFVNTRLAETWEDDGDRVSQNELARRATDRPLGVVPYGGLMVVQGVDTQPDRLERRVWAFGRGERAWLIEVEVIYGDPNLPESAEQSPWKRLTESWSTLMPHASGQKMPIEATFIDSGGHNTQAVYSYCRDHSRRDVFAVKGASQPGRPPVGKPGKVDISWHGRTLSQGLLLWPIGTDTIKTMLFGRLRLSMPGPGYIDLPKKLAETDEFEQLTSERLLTSYVNGKVVLKWIKQPGKRNEALDCFVYAYAAAVHVGLSRMRETDWERREQRYAPVMQDLFGVAASAPVDGSAQEHSHPAASLPSAVAASHSAESKHAIRKRRFAPIDLM